MIGVLRHLWARHRLLLLAFLLAATLTLVFAVRSVVFVLYWNDPSHRNQAIAGWMMPGYVAYSYHVPRRVITDALGLAKGRHSRSLGKIARDRGVSMSDLDARLTAAIAAYRVQNK